jgi:DNA repair protein RecO (recombination protein O)
MYTELFGIQSYIVSGVRTEKKGGTRAGMFQPAAILDMVVYHQDQRNLHRMKEYKWGYVYRQVYTGVIKNTLVIYMMEMLQKCLKQPEANPDLYEFIETALLRLDEADDLTAANYALHFTLALAAHLGFQIGGRHSPDTPVLDLQEGVYVAGAPSHVYSLDGYLAEATSLLMEAETVGELGAIRLNRELRRSLLEAYQLFYALHVPDFGKLRSLPVLQDILG